MTPRHRRSWAGSYLGEQALRVGAIFLMIFAAVGLTALPASAHQPEISAQVDCSGLVSYEATAWMSDEPNRRTHTNIEISYSLTGRPGSFVEVDSGVFNESNDYSFAGTFQLDEVPDQLFVRATARGKWGAEGDFISGTGGEKTETEVSVPTDCSEPGVADPSATITANCYDGFTVTVVNDGDGEGVVTVTLQDGSTEDITVPAGETVTRTYGFVGEDVEETVSVSFDGQELASLSYTPDCDPKASITTDCDGFTVTVTAPPDAQRQVTAILPDGSTERILVRAGMTETRVYPATEDVEQTVSVRFRGQILATATFTRDCEQPPPGAPEPSATITTSCDGFTVTVVNGGETEGVVTVTKPDGTTEDIPVPAGDTVTRTYPATEDVEQTVTVSFDGQELASSTFTKDCVLSDIPPNPPVNPPNPPVNPPQVVVPPRVLSDIPVLPLADTGAGNALADIGAGNALAASGAGSSVAASGAGNALADTRAGNAQLWAPFGLAFVAAGGLLLGRRRGTSES